ncbi:MAG: hypothetical protein KKC09_08935 [Gammaproteobacteria bacterium]|nr:hypothetical protein [Gammaproteobacteria bacterium]
MLAWRSNCCGSESDSQEKKARIESIRNVQQRQQPAFCVFVDIDPGQIDNLYRGAKFRQTE